MHVRYAHICMHIYGKIAIYGKSRLKPDLIYGNRSYLKSLRIHYSGKANKLCTVGRYKSLVLVNSGEWRGGCLGKLWMVL